VRIAFHSSVNNSIGDVTHYYLRNILETTFK